MGRSAIAKDFGTSGILKEIGQNRGRLSNNIQDSSCCLLHRFEAPSCEDEG